MKRILLTLTLVLFVLTSAKAQINLVLNGDSEVFIEYGDYYYEEGASFSSGIEGDETDVIEISDNINLKELGSYTVTYTATNSSGETATITRSVTVRDNTSPRFIVKDRDYFNIYPNKLDYSFDYIAVDNYDGDITDQVSYSFGTKTTIPGQSFSDTLRVTDSNGNTRTKLLKIYVRENQGPSLKVISDNDDSNTVNILETFRDPGVYAFDNVDGDITDNVTVDNSALDLSVEGDYDILYSITNSAGLTETATRTVTVVKNYTTWKLSENDSENVLYTFSEYDDELPNKKYDIIYDDLYLERSSFLRLESFNENSDDTTTEWAIGDINHPEYLNFYEDHEDLLQSLQGKAWGLTEDNVRLIMKIAEYNILVEFNIHYWAPGGDYVSYSRGSGPGDKGESESLVVHNADIWKIEGDNHVSFVNHTYDGNPAKEHDKIFNTLHLKRNSDNGLFNAKEFDYYNEDIPDGLYWLMVHDSWSLDDLKYIPLNMFLNEFKHATNENMRRLSEGFKYLMYYERENTIIEIDFIDWSEYGYSYVRGSSDTDLGGPDFTFPNLKANLGMDDIKKFRLGNNSDITIESFGVENDFHNYSDRLTYLSALSFESDEPFNSGLENEESNHINLMWYRGSMPTTLNAFLDNGEHDYELDELGSMEIITIYLPSEKIAFEIQMERYDHSNSYKYTRPVIQETFDIGPHTDGFSSEQTNYALLVGNGTNESPSNAMALDYSGNMTISGDLNINSDKSIKNNIMSLGATLELLTQIDGKKYNLINDKSNQTKIGLIAQEVEKFFPEIVSEQNGVKSVNYIGLIPVLINAIKEQQAQINNLINDNNK
jgi:hypothetical protein